MKTKFVVSTIFFVIALSLILPRSYGSAYASQGAGRCFPPPAGLTGWWPGDGNTDDIVGGRDVDLHDNATFATGLVGQAFNLDGDGDFVSVPHDPELNLGNGDFTVDLWVYFNNTEGEQVLIEKWVQRFTEEPPIGSRGWTLTKLDNNSLRLAMAAGGQEFVVDSDPLSIPDQTWTHFAATRKTKRRNTKIVLYMNGVPVATGTYLVNLDSGSSIKFGHRGILDDTPDSEGGAGYYLNGKIDEVDIFVDRALPPGLIRAIYNARIAGKCKD